MIVRLLFFSYFLLLLTATQLTAQVTDESTTITFAHEIGPVEKLKQPQLLWFLTWRSSDEQTTSMASVNAPAGELAVTLNTETQQLTKYVAGLQCEESRKLNAGFRSGRCTLLLTACEAEERPDVFFNYRVTKHIEHDTTLGDTATHVSKLYEEGDNEDAVEVGTVTYSVENSSDDERDPSVAFILEFNLTVKAGGCKNWIPSWLKVEGLSPDEVEMRTWRRRAATSVVERWGYPLLLAAAVYGALHALTAIARRHQQAAAEKRKKMK